MSVRERAFMKAERDRLLYVAATRAKQMLVVSLYPEQPAKCPWSSLMEGMDRVRELDVPESDEGTEECHEEMERDIASIDMGAYLAQREQVAISCASLLTRKQPLLD